MLSARQIIHGHHGISFWTTYEFKAITRSRIRPCSRKFFDTLTV